MEGKPAEIDGDGESSLEVPPPIAQRRPFVWQQGERVRELVDRVKALKAKNAALRGEDRTEKEIEVEHEEEEEQTQEPEQEQEAGEIIRPAAQDAKEGGGSSVMTMLLAVVFIVTTAAFQPAHHKHIHGGVTRACQLEARQRSFMCRVCCRLCHGRRRQQ